MNGPPEDRCGYTWPENSGRDSLARQQNCCYRKTYQNYNRCIWHVSPEKSGKKSIDDLKQARAPREIRDLNSPYDELLPGAKLQGHHIREGISFENTVMRNADISDCLFSGMNFSGAHLFKANLSNTSFFGCNLSNALFEEATLHGTDFNRSDMIEARLDVTNLQDVSFRGANLTNASFQEAQLNDVILYDANIQGANMKYVEIGGVNINQATNIGRQTRAEEHAESAYDWDLIAQAYHELKLVFSEQSFVGKARNMHVLERRARALEAKAASDRLNGWLNPTYLGSLLSRVFTGYGVRIRYLVFWMVALFFFSTGWYVLTGVEDNLTRIFTYSVITFTTSPPFIPSGSGTQIVTMIETFFGTLAIVLLGYILGNREQF